MCIKLSKGSAPAAGPLGDKDAQLVCTMPWSCFGTLECFVCFLVTLLWPLGVLLELPQGSQIIRSLLGARLVLSWGTLGPSWRGLSRGSLGTLWGPLGGRGGHGGRKRRAKGKRGLLPHGTPRVIDILLAEGLIRPTATALRGLARERR